MSNVDDIIFKSKASNEEEKKAPKRKRDKKAADKEPVVGTRKSTRPKNAPETYNLDVLLPKITDAPSELTRSPMLASKYDGTQDIKGWIMSEKLDGVR